MSLLWFFPMIVLSALMGLQVPAKPSAGQGNPKPRS